MTRFARAKGSKASNEKAPEDGTPWEVMRDQLLQSQKEKEESKKRIEAENKRQENYEKFCKERKVQKQKSSWCDFPQNVTNISKKPKLDFTESATASGSDKQHDNKVTKKEKKKSAKKSQLDKNNDVAKPKNPSQVPEIDNSSNVEFQKPQSKKNRNESSTKGKNNKAKQNNLKGDVKPARRKPIDDRSFQLIINGKEIELVRYDGFPIMKKDADRLQELKDSMIKKGIPKSEVQRTMKLERRRAEKALARLKRDVCYNCRKGGHNLSDCPELKSKIPGADVPDGICFKCGSTEHKSYECKVQRDQGFRFATCFICKEQGHIARQCPDNPKGLYPNGGGCKLCGDVTHLRKDCPTVKDKKEESAVRLDTFSVDDNLEGSLVTQQNTPETKVRKPKKIKF